MLFLYLKWQVRLSGHTLSLLRTSLPFFILSIFHTPLLKNFIRWLCRCECSVSGTSQPSLVLVFFCDLWTFLLGFFLMDAWGILGTVKALMEAYWLSVSVVAWWIHCIFSLDQQLRHPQHITQASPPSHGLPGNPESTTGQSNQSTFFLRHGGGVHLIFYSAVIMGSQGGNPRQGPEGKTWSSNREDRCLSAGFSANFLPEFYSLHSDK